MRAQIPALAIGLPILIVWLGMVATAVIGYWLVQWWKRRHPPPRRPPQQSYSRELPQRLAARNAGRNEPDVSASDRRPP